MLVLLLHATYHLTYNVPNESINLRNLKVLIKLFTLCWFLEMEMPKQLEYTSKSFQQNFVFFEFQYY